MFCWPVIFKHVAPFLEQDRKQLSICWMRKSQNHREEMPESQDRLFQGLWFCWMSRAMIIPWLTLSIIQAVSGCWVGIGCGNMDFFTREIHLSFHVWYYICEFSMGVFSPAYMSMYHMHAQGSQRRVPNLLGLGSGTWSSARAAGTFDCWAISLTFLL